jgi:hypothetical protein
MTCQVRVCVTRVTWQVPNTTHSNPQAGRCSRLRDKTDLALASIQRFWRGANTLRLILLQTAKSVTRAQFARRDLLWLLHSFVTPA